jgi:hypothetical protein
MLVVQQPALKIGVLIPAIASSRRSAGHAGGRKAIVRHRAGYRDAS